jgi:hypothetical protein
MKKILFILLFISNLAYSQNLFYKVDSNIGLSLRDKPSALGKKILMIPNKSIVKVIKFFDDKFSLNDKEKIISGFWAKIKIKSSSNKSFENKIGYVFSGYLKPLDSYIESDEEEGKYSKISLNSSKSCSFNGEPFEDDIYSFTSSKEATSIIDEIVGIIGLKRNFEIKAGNVPNASAVIIYGKRHVIYSQSFISKIIIQSNSYWAAIAVLAHEIGHHLNGHTLDGIGSRPPKELEADEFAGFIMSKMGASLSQSQSIFNNDLMYQPHDSKTHPASSARIEAIAVGWQRAKEKTLKKDKKTFEKKIKKQQTSNKDIRNNPLSYLKVQMDKDFEDFGGFSIKYYRDYTVTNSSNWGIKITVKTDYGFYRFCDNFSENFNLKGTVEKTVFIPPNSFKDFTLATPTLNGNVNNCGGIRNGSYYALFTD